MVSDDDKFEEPYVSFVVVARNDDHGGNFLGRVQIFVSGLLELIKKHNLKSEIIIVEWNPPLDKPRLSNALSWPHNYSSCKIRFIEVPNQIHKRFKHSDKFALFEFIGKNVGIRRAHGKFVISTNPDLLFSNDLIKFLGKKSLQTNSFYRIDRTDVKNSIPYPASVDKQFEFCKNHITMVHGKYGSFKPDTKKDTKEISNNLSVNKKNNKDVVEPYPELHTNASGDFMMMERRKWHELRGYPELEMLQLHLDSVICHMAYHYGLKEKILNSTMKIYHMEHSGGWNPEKANEVYQRLKDRGMPFYDFKKYQSLVTQMQNEGRPIIFNNKNWGLGTEVLPETSLN